MSNKNDSFRNGLQSGFRPKWNDEFKSVMGERPMAS
jgi:hypothetical protein